MALSGTISKTWNTGWTYKISWSATQSTSKNTSTITCVHTLTQSSGYGLSIGTRSNTCTVDGTSKTFTSPAINQTGGTISLGTTTHTVTHNSDGTKTCTITGVFKMQATIDGTYNESITATGTITLNTIARKSTITVANGELEVEQTLTITRQSTSFNHSLKFTCGDVSGYINSSGEIVSTEVKYTTTSLKFTPPIDWALQQPSANNAVVVFTLTTYNGDTKIGTHTPAKMYYYIPDSIVPTVSYSSITDALGFKENHGKYIQGFSKALVDISVDTSNAYGATVSKYTTTLDGVTYDGSNFTSNVLNNPGELRIVTTITDSRGRTNTVEDIVDVHSYSRPILSDVSVKRTDASGNSMPAGEYLTVIFDSTITELPSGNSPAYTIRYGETGGELGDPVAPNVGDNPYSVVDGYLIFQANTSSTYDIIIAVSDPIVSSDPITKTLLGPTASVFFSQKARGAGAAFGKVATRDGALQSGWDIYDKFDTLVGNGLAVGGEEDPDYTLNTLIVTSNNTPMGEGYTMYVHTMFDGDKTVTSNRAQYAIPHGFIGSMYHRYFIDGSWTDWRRHVNEDEIVDPVEPADYIVERGTSGIWTYEKYNSGVAKCWGGTSVAFTGNQEWVTPWYYMTSGTVSYPSGLFTATPILTYSKTSYGALEMLTIGASGGSKTATPKFRIAKPSAYSADASRTISFYAYGKWK